MDRKISQKEGKLIDEIRSLEEALWRSTNRRIELLEELKTTELEESNINTQLTEKKSELRKLSEQSQLSSSKSKARAPPLSASTREFSFQFKHPDKAQKDLEEEGQAIEKAIANKQPKTPKIKPKLLDKIVIEDATVFSKKLLVFKESRLFEIIPKLKCEELKDKKFVFDLAGPILPSSNNSSSVAPPPAEAYNDFFCAKTISTYPLSFTKDQREGDPICDRFAARLYTNRAIVAIADGCNWGQRPREAATKACEGFCQHMQIENYKTLSDIADRLLGAVCTAHNKIIEGKDDAFEAGTTTLLGGMLVEMKDNEEGIKWAFLCVSVGDCKAFHWSSTSGELHDITIGNRINLTDASDPGGRIGPYRKGGMPDIRNLDLYFQECQKGDLIILCSDGLHDNLDPQQLGKMPKDFGINAESWKQAEKEFPEETEFAKTQSRNSFLYEQLNNQTRNKKDYTLIDICSHLVQHCWYLTKKSREFMENNPNKKLPEDYNLYPGKMDHTTVSVLRVGMYN